MSKFLFLLLLPIFLHAQEIEKLTIHFPKSGAVPEQPIQPFLDSLVRKKNIISLSIDAYCDATENDAYNDALSEKRAASVKTILSDYIDMNKIKVESHGRRMPVNLNRTEEEQYINRRVELTIKTEPISPISKDTATTIQTTVALIDDQSNSTCCSIYTKLKLALHFV